MKLNISKITFVVSLGLVFLFGGASRTPAQVKQVEMHIGGYLCGN